MICIYFRETLSGFMCYFVWFLRVSLWLHFSSMYVFLCGFIYTVYKKTKGHNSVVKVGCEKHLPQNAMTSCFCCGVWSKKLKTFQLTVIISISVVSVVWPRLVYLILLLPVATTGLSLFMQTTLGITKWFLGDDKWICCPLSYGKNSF